MAVIFEEADADIPTSSLAGVEFLGGPVSSETGLAVEASAQFEEARFVCIIAATTLALLCSEIPSQEHLVKLFAACSDQIRMILADKLFDENDIPERVETTPKDIRRSLAPRYLVSC